jgi:molybdopterin-guanine dinucleotide biosynthesis protein A
MNAILLAGGHSRRMGRDKAWLAYHGQPHWAYLHQLLTPLVETVYLSVRAGQIPAFPASVSCLPDKYPGIGPMGGILTAMQQDESSAWLVLACDLPWLDAPTLAELIAHRDPKASVTAFRSPVDGGIEPLVALWEPRSRAYLEQGLQAGRYSLRRALSAANVRLIDASDPQALRNVNSPSDYPSEGLP